MLLSAVMAGDAHAAFPIWPPDQGRVDTRAAEFAFGLDPGDHRAKIVLAEDDGSANPADPEEYVWTVPYRLESPWSTSGKVRWRLGVFPGFYAWRLCLVDEETPDDVECDLGPEIRFVAVTDGPLKPCAGSFVAGFFRNIAAARAGCGTARNVVRGWIKRSRFGERGVPARLRVGRWACRFRLIQTRENPYGRITCTTRRRKVVRFYGIS